MKEAIGEKKMERKTSMGSKRMTLSEKDSLMERVIARLRDDLVLMEELKNLKKYEVRLRVLPAVLEDLESLKTTTDELAVTAKLEQIKRRLTELR